MKENRDREKHYRSNARYYTNLAILKKLKASVHLENKEDERFWKKIFKYHFPGKKFYFIAYSKNPHGNYTAGSSQCLAYQKFLNRNFLICIDSDYRYLSEEENINIKHLIFQTYTYSFENHLCFSDGLSNVCRAICGYKNNVFDFNCFYETFSSIIYELFVRHFALYKKHPKYFPIKSFCQVINVPHRGLIDRPEAYFSRLKSRTDSKMNEIKQRYPDVDVEKTKKLLARLGIHRHNTYLYIRGHNLYSHTSQIVRIVCKKILDQQRLKLGKDKDKIENLYRERKSFRKAIAENVQFECYPEIEKIASDMNTYQNMFL